MSVSRSATLRWTPGRSSRVVSSAKSRSTRLSQELLVGVKCRWKRGVADEPAADLGGFVGGVVVQDEVHVVLGGDLAVELVEELAELGGAVLAVQAAVDVAGGHIECGEQAGRAVADVGVGLA